MLTRNYLTALLFPILALCSCNTERQMQAAVAETTLLRKTNTSLSEKNFFLESDVKERDKQISSLKEQSAFLQKEITGLRESNTSVYKEYAAYKFKCEEKSNELASLNTALDELGSNIDALMEKLETALEDFENKGVEIYKRDGLIYVSLQEDLLYKPGSAVLGTAGKNALGSLAAALDDYPDLKILVVGNTDNVQFKKGSDNWSLSTERANGVVRILRDEYKIDPLRLTAAGRGKYDPVTGNDSPEGRAKNRRTEIVLSPDLRKVWASIIK
jgi:chemotaxis protein MotB